MKAQSVRVLDVLLFGPLMIWLASQDRPLTDRERMALTVVGWGTIGYNLWNLLRISKR